MPKFSKQSYVPSSVAKEREMTGAERMRESKERDEEEEERDEGEEARGIRRRKTQ